MSKRFPIQIVRKNAGEEFTAVTSIHIITSASRNIRKELSFLEQDYTTLVRGVRDIITMAVKSKKADVRLYWIAADSVMRYLTRLDDLGFYLMKQNKTLGRDTGLSVGSVQKLLAFRKRFTKISLVDPSYSWAKYRANKVPVPK